MWRATVRTGLRPGVGRPVDARVGLLPFNWWQQRRIWDRYVLLTRLRKHDDDDERETPREAFVGKTKPFRHGESSHLDVAEPEWFGSGCE